MEAAWRVAGKRTPLLKGELPRTTIRGDAREDGVENNRLDFHNEIYNFYINTQLKPYLVFRFISVVIIFPIFIFFLH